MLPFTSSQLKAQERSSWLVTGRELTLRSAIGYVFVLMRQVGNRVDPLFRERPFWAALIIQVLASRLESFYYFFLKRFFVEALVISAPGTRMDIVTEMPLGAFVCLGLGISFLWFFRIGNFSLEWSRGRVPLDDMAMVSCLLEIYSSRRQLVIYELYSYKWLS